MKFPPNSRNIWYLVSHQTVSVNTGKHIWYKINNFSSFILCLLRSVYVQLIATQTEVS